MLYKGMPMSFFKCMLVLFGCSSIAFAFTRQDLEQMKSELDNPITLEMLEGILLESGFPFEKQISQYSNRPEYQGVCKFSSDTLPIYVSTEFDHVASNYDTYKEKRILRNIHYGSSKDHPAYRFVNGRFQYHEDSYWDNDPKKRKSVEFVIQKSNSILDKIDRLNFACKNSTQCHVNIQTRTIYQLSDMLGSRGICNGEGPMQTCNYQLALDDGKNVDMTITYLNSGDKYGHNYTPLSIIFNDVEKPQVNAAPTKTVKIGKQEWMIHNLFYGEGLTVKYGVDIVANKDLSNITDGDYDSKSYALPSGEKNSWFVFMDLNLRSRDYEAFLEKPDIKEHHQGICPIGFHVPTFAEWKELFSFVAKDKVRFPKYELFDAYEKAIEKLPNNVELAFASVSDLEKIRKQQKKLESIEKELDVAYNKWRKGRKDRFNCSNGEKCRYDKHDMRNRIDEEIINHLCAKGAWPFDENGEDQCLDSYGFSMLSDSKKGNEISYWTADAKVSQCHDVFENGRHQCTYDVEGYKFSINYGWQGVKHIDSKNWTSSGFAYLRCIKNGGEK